MKNWIYLVWISGNQLKINLFKKTNTMKEKLIQLFKKTLNDYSVPRSFTGVNYNIVIKEKILKQVYETNIGNYIRCDVIEQKNSMFSSGWFFTPMFSIKLTNAGFSFKEDPPIIIAKTQCWYFAQYKPSFFWLGKDKKEKKQEGQNLLNQNKCTKFNKTEYYCFGIREDKYVLVQGTCFAEISNELAKQLFEEFEESVYAYDKHKLEERLSNNKQII